MFGCKAELVVVQADFCVYGAWFIAVLYCASSALSLYFAVVYNFHHARDLAGQIVPMIVSKCRKKAKKEPCARLRAYARANARCAREGALRAPI